MNRSAPQKGHPIDQWEAKTMGDERFFSSKIQDYSLWDSDCGQAGEAQMILGLLAALAMKKIDLSFQRSPPDRQLRKPSRFGHQDTHLFPFLWVSMGVPFYLMGVPFYPLPTQRNKRVRVLILAANDILDYSLPASISKSRRPFNESL